MRQALDRNSLDPGIIRHRPAVVVLHAAQICWRGQSPQRSYVCGHSSTARVEIRIDESAMLIREYLAFGFGNSAAPQSVPVPFHRLYGVQLAMCQAAEIISRAAMAPGVFEGISPADNSQRLQRFDPVL